MAVGLGMVGSKVERVNRRSVRKSRRTQIEMVDWVLVRMGLLGLILLMVVLPILLGVEWGVTLPTMGLEGVMAEEAAAAGFSSGKKTKSNPMPQFSLLVLAFHLGAVMAISLFLCTFGLVESGTDACYLASL